MFILVYIVGQFPKCREELDKTHPQLSSFLLSMFKDKDNQCYAYNNEEYVVMKNYVCDKPGFIVGDFICINEILDVLFASSESISVHSASLLQFNIPTDGIISTLVYSIVLENSFISIQNDINCRVSQIGGCRTNSDIILQNCPSVFVVALEVPARIKPTWKWYLPPSFIDIDLNLLLKSDVEYSLFAVNYLQGVKHYITLIKINECIHEYDGMIEGSAAANFITGYNKGRTRVVENLTNFPLQISTKCGTSRARNICVASQAWYIKTELISTMISSSSSSSSSSCSSANNLLCHGIRQFFSKL